MRKNRKTNGEAKYVEKVKERKKESIIGLLNIEIMERNSNYFQCMWKYWTSTYLKSNYWDIKEMLFVIFHFSGVANILEYLLSNS